MVERGQQLAQREVPGAAEDHEVEFVYRYKIGHGFLRGDEILLRFSLQKTPKIGIKLQN